MLPRCIEEPQLQRSRFEARDDPAFDFERIVRAISLEQFFLRDRKHQFAIAPIFPQKF